MTAVSRAFAAMLILGLAALGTGSSGCGSAGGQSPQATSDGAAPGGEVLLRRIAAAYRDVPALVDKMDLDISGQGITHRAEGQVLIGAGTDAQVTIEGFRITALGKEFYLERLDRPDKFMQQALQGDLTRSFQAIAGTVVAVPQCLLRSGGDTQSFLSALSLARLQQPRLAGAGRAERDGRMLDELRLEGSNGSTAQALVEPETGFLVALNVSAGGLSFNAEMDPKPAKQLAQPITVQTQGRRRVDTIQQLVALGVGDLAPDFKLESLDGTTVSLAELRGRMVVVDFWATWCGPCRMSLPKLQEFDTWARNEGVPVTVLAVNTAERVNGKDARRERTAGFWKGQPYTMPCLMDYDDSVAMAYGSDALPYSVVVGPDGRILEVERGFNPGMVEHLKALAGRKPS